MNRKTKNILLGVILVIFTIVICTGIYFIGQKFNNKENFTNIKELSISELKNKIDNKDTFVLIYTRTGCSHCESFLPIANSVGKKYNITFYNINTSNAKTPSDQSILRNIANVSGTPTTVFIYNGEEKNTTNRLVGEVKEYKLIDKLKSEGYINE